MNYKPGEATLFGSTNFGFTGQAILRDALPNDPLGQSQWEFHEGFIALNIINFADMARREKDGVSWDVRRVLSP